MQIVTEILYFYTEQVNYEEMMQISTTTWKTIPDKMPQQSGRQEPGNHIKVKEPHLTIPPKHIALL